MFRKSQVNPAPVCVLLGGPKTAEAVQGICVLLRSTSAPNQSQPFWRHTHTSVWGMTDKLCFFLFG